MRTKTISINGKTSDCFSMVGQSESGDETGYYDGYVPKFFPGEHWGDYIQLDIDVKTGQILNWKPPTQEQLIELFEKNKDDI